jgi:hypothetical protein
MGVRGVRMVLGAAGIPLVLLLWFDLHHGVRDGGLGI